MVERGYGRVVRTVKRFLEEHGFNVHLGAWVDVMVGERLVFDFQVGHWFFFRPPRRGVPSALYVFSEGRIPRRAREWLSGYDYLFAPSKWIASMLEELDLDYIYMPVGIDTQLFRPVNVDKWIDVLSVGIWESSWDDRKFMHLVPEACKPYNCYVHMRPSLRIEELPALYSSARLYLSLSGCEGFNIPVLEANACGVPVVYNDAPATNEHAYGVPVKPRRVYEVVDRGVPFLVHEPDVEKIREAVHRLLRDPRRLEEMGREARRHAEKYDYRITFAPLLEVLPQP